MNWIISRLIYSFVKTLNFTYRYRYVGLDSLKEAEKLGTPGSYLLGVWHQNLLAGIMAQTNKRHVVIISKSKDATSMSDPAKYRTREEVQKMRSERDPIEQVRDLLLTGKHATEEDLKAIDKEIKEVVNQSAEFARTSPEPALEELWTDIYAEV